MGDRLDNQGAELGDRPGVGAASDDLAPSLETRTTYQVILRHLARLRDGARSVLDLFGSSTTTSEAPAAATAVAPPSLQHGQPEPEPKTPLEMRIERHMG